MDFGAIAGAAKAVSGVLGIFRKKKKDPTPRENLLSQAQGAREASEKYGFNPLTMLQYGQTGGAMAGGGGGAAPLASLQMLTDGLKGLDDIVSGDRARRRAADELEIDLARLRLEQMRSGVVIQDRTARDGAFATPSPLGRNTVTHLPQGSVARYTGLASNGGEHERPNEGHPLDSDLGAIAQPDATLDRGSGLFGLGGWLRPAPGWSSGQQFEDEYGDTPLSWPYAAGKLAADVGYNVNRGLMAAGIPTFRDPETGESLVDRAKKRRDDRRKRPKQNPRAKYRERGTGPIWPDNSRTR